MASAESVLLFCLSRPTQRHGRCWKDELTRWSTAHGADSSATWAAELGDLKDPGAEHSEALAAFHADLRRMAAERVHLDTHAFVRRLCSGHREF